MNLAIASFSMIKRVCTYLASLKEDWVFWWTANLISNSTLRFAFSKFALDQSTRQRSTQPHLSAMATEQERADAFFLRNIDLDENPSPSSSSSSNLSELNSDDFADMDISPTPRDRGLTSGMHIDSVGNYLNPTPLLIIIVSTTTTATAS